MTWATVRDVLALDPNPARLSAAAIAKQLGIGVNTARELRTLACRSPQVLAEQAARVARPQGRAVSHG